MNKTKNKRLKKAFKIQLMKNKNWNRQLNHKVQLLAIIYNKLIIMSLKFVN
jgi:hypothetical protein